MLYEAFLESKDIIKDDSNAPDISLSESAIVLDEINGSSYGFSYKEEAIILNTILEADDMSVLDEGVNMDMRDAFKLGRAKFKIEYKLARKAIKDGDDKEAKKHISELYKIVDKMEKDIKKFDKEQDVPSAIIGYFLGCLLFFFNHLHILAVALIPVAGGIASMVVAISEEIKLLVSFINDLRSAKEITPAQFNYYRQVMLKLTADLKMKIMKLKNAL
jgi:hypothetical protein